MPFATAHTVSLHGALGHLIDVQADVSPGTVGTTLIGRPDVSLNEARDRCRMAAINSGLEWPMTRRVTVLLAPADLAKSGTHFDLAIAVSVLAAADRVPGNALAGTAFVGELTLSGGLRSVPGVLPMVLAAAQRGIARVFVPEPQAREASMVPGMTVFGMRSLGQVVAELRGAEVPEAPPVAPMSGSRLLAWRGQERLEELDFRDLFGMEDAKYAVEVAAAGGHPVLLTGPKGAGKTSLAERVPTILPELIPEESLELTAIHSLAGALEPGDGMLTTPPYSGPHHDASKASLIGGGSGQVRPGEISRAHCGVLFLDEFPLFRSDVIEALRQPLGERGDHGGATRGVGDVAGPVPFGPGLQSLPVRWLHRVGSHQPVPLQRAAAARLSGADHRPDRRPDRHHPAGRAAESVARPTRGTGVFGAGPRPRRSDPGSATPAIPSRELAPQWPGPGCRTPRLLAVAAGGAAQPRGSRVRRPAEQSGCGARPPARLDHRRPAVCVLR